MPLMQTKNAVLTAKLLALLLAALCSMFLLSAKLPGTRLYQSTLESVEESQSTVMKLSAATLSTSLALSALPDDFASPLAESLSDMNIYFIAILMIIFLEKLLLRFGTLLAFRWIIPIVCALVGGYVLLGKPLLKDVAVRLCILGLAITLVVPFSTLVTHLVADDLTDYVEATIRETEDGAAKLNEAVNDDTAGKNIFERLSDLFETAMNGISDLMLHFQNTIRKCMNSIAILLLTNFLMPLLSFFLLRWVLSETFHIVIPVSRPRRAPRAHGGGADGAEPVAAGGHSHEG